MNHLLEKRGLSHKYQCDSAGTSSFHAGDLPDAKYQACSKERNRSEFRSDFDKSVDFEAFDMILVMDKENYKFLKSLDIKNVYGCKVRFMTDFSLRKAEFVPDPYFTGSDGFEEVLDILGCYSRAFRTSSE